MSSLLPRLDKETVEGLIAGLPLACTADRPHRERPLALCRRVTFAPSGGTPASTRQLIDLRNGIERIAEECGWPEQRSAESIARFDARVAAYLAEHELLATGESQRDDTWACIATELVPQVVLWRSGRTSERFHGGVRNAFQKLWIRGTLLDRGPDARDRRWELLDQLSEDAMVAIVERPSLAADKRLALAIAEGWARSSARIGRSKMEPVMRAAVLSLRLKNELILLCLLDCSALADVVNAAFVAAESRHGESAGD